ncbi:hypothetical protein GZ77_15845 [Endozoicomonas montiporae]|uniref:Uncharacterized protein n=1 Tax=Endozoicomonas montiporae TaxID=1027273 RepID=A0A081N5N7_9GAMM|nr:hypothetical protein [Endozoicomonas montiporae]KEQ11560.1 hypothetical protein GZ77_23840 [Endozoicomonas montiporae]KEQ13760.1 hypothetical protein GZ77_15845 [Endozoicomonas montiporae]
MSTSKTLAEKLAAHPELENRVSELINLVEAESGYLDRADEAEEAVIENLKELGNELLTDWGSCKEKQRFDEAHALHPESKAKKKTFTG